MLTYDQAAQIADMAPDDERGKAVPFSNSGGFRRWLRFKREAGFIAVMFMDTCIARIYEDQIILNHHGYDTLTTGEAYRALGINWSHRNRVAYVGGTRYHENHPVPYAGTESGEHWLLTEAKASMENQ